MLGGIWCYLGGSVFVFDGKFGIKCDVYCCEVWLMVGKVIVVNVYYLGCGRWRG